MEIAENSVSESCFNSSQVCLTARTNFFEREPAAEVDDYVVDLVELPPPPPEAQADADLEYPFDEGPELSFGDLSEESDYEAPL